MALGEPHHLRDSYGLRIPVPARHPLLELERALMVVVLLPVLSRNSSSSDLSPSSHHVVRLPVYNNPLNRNLRHARPIFFGIGGPETLAGLGASLPFQAIFRLYCPLAGVSFTTGRP